MYRLYIIVLYQPITKLERSHFAQWIAQRQVIL
jgi:hypothetical protein